MRILITTPSLNVHGGIRVLVEWANHLNRRGHRVTLQVESGSMSADWIDIDEDVIVMPGPNWHIAGYDVAIAGCPPLALKMDGMQGAKKFFLLQMAEHLFNSNKGWQNLCFQSYQVAMPIIGISQWVEEEVRKHRRDGIMYYIGNGVTKHFKPGKRDDGLTILVEGWESGPRGYKNPAKDTLYIGARVAAEIKKRYGARVIAFSQYPQQAHIGVADEYYRAPGTDQIAHLYQRATLMVKASIYDARSCAPVEAMACGTVTSRGLDFGDDDLENEYNCLRCEYDYDNVLKNTIRLIDDEGLRRRLESNGLRYRKTYLDWDKWMQEVENIIEADEQTPRYNEPQSRRRFIS